MVLAGCGPYSLLLDVLGGRSHFKKPCTVVADYSNLSADIVALTLEALRFDFAWAQETCILQPQLVPHAYHVLLRHNACH